MTQTGCPICGHDQLEPLFHWTEPPAVETRFSLPDGVAYDREFLRCPRCGHMVGRTALDVAAFYEGAYVDATYSADGLARAFARIMALPPERSDNAGRVRRVTAFAEHHGNGGRSALDVGSGLAVFPARMKEAGWECTALDPDPRAVAHARDTAGVPAVAADFMQADDLGRYDLVTFNKVLEHVPDPVAMLERARSFCAPGGIVYVEVPDGESAATDGPEREEFTIEHLHAFSMASLALLAARAGLTTLRSDRLREPSDKYTLTAFLR